MVQGDSIEGAIVASIAYMDVFACAPRAGEIHRFLVGKKASRAEVERCLAQSRDLHEIIGMHEGFYYLRGKRHLVPRRVRFLEHSRRIWPRARDIARRIERSGLATCGMVTGSLAADNADEHADIDFLFTYPTGRAWSSYALVRMVAKLPSFKDFCPNYALPENKLQVRPQNLFVAWEIAKAIPLFGFDGYERFVHANRWVAELLPNALPLLDAQALPGTVKKDPALIRAVTDRAAFRWLEAREKNRKFARDTRDVGVDMKGRQSRGSIDRHAPTRSFQALCELRYRWEMFGLQEHPMYPLITEWTTLLDDEMTRWGEERLPSIPAPAANARA